MSSPPRAATAAAGQLASAAGRPVDGGPGGSGMRLLSSPCCNRGERRTASDAGDGRSPSSAVAVGGRRRATKDSLTGLKIGERGDQPAGKRANAFSPVWISIFTVLDHRSKSVTGWIQIGKRFLLKKVMLIYRFGSTIQNGKDKISFDTHR